MIRLYSPDEFYWAVRTSLPVLGVSVVRTDVLTACSVVLHTGWRRRRLRAGQSPDLAGEIPLDHRLGAVFTALDLGRERPKSWKPLSGRFSREIQSNRPRFFNPQTVSTIACHTRFPGPRRACFTIAYCSLTTARVL